MTPLKTDFHKFKGGHSIRGVSKLQNYVPPSKLPDFVIGPDSLENKWQGSVLPALGRVAGWDSGEAPRGHAIEI